MKDKPLETKETTERCPKCKCLLFSNGVNIWCKVCNYGVRFPVLVKGAKKSD